MPSAPEKNIKNPKMKQFDELLLTAIDNAFISLGESVKKSIYFHLEEKFELKRSQIPSKLVKFQEAIEKIFGSGARFLEILIMKNLYINSKISVTVESNQVCFLDYVKEVKRVYLE
jgi:hypothetical protein